MAQAVTGRGQVEQVFRFKYLPGSREHGMDRLMLRIGRCQCCFRSTLVDVTPSLSPGVRKAFGPSQGGSEARASEGGVCLNCAEDFGAPIAKLVGRARIDTDFAKACLLRMTPAAQQLFADACGFALDRRFSLRLTPGLRKCGDRGRLFQVASGA
jgi:hypothetical protein